MKWLLILYAAGYGFSSTPVIHQFESREQCEAVRKHIVDAHGTYRDSECISIDEKGNLKP